MSRRCTTPGTAPVAAPDAALQQALDERAVLVARRPGARPRRPACRRRAATRPRRRPVSGTSSARAARAPAAGAANSTVSPARSTWCFAPAARRRAPRPPRWRAPRADAREGGAARETTSRRAPRSSPTTKRSVPLPAAPASGALRHGAPARRRAATPATMATSATLKVGHQGDGDEVEDRASKRRRSMRFPSRAAEHARRGVAGSAPARGRRRRPAATQSRRDEREDRPAGVAEPAERDAAVHRDLEAARRRARSSGRLAAPRRTSHFVTWSSGHDGRA